MASSLCRSMTLTNIFVHQVVALDITELEAADENKNNQWAYVISVTWSDMRETKIFRSYNELSNLYLTSYKIRHSDRFLKTKICPNIPKVPGRGFFDWSLIKLMIRNQPKIDYFLKVLITLPPEISRNKQTLDFFEERPSDNHQNSTRNSKINLISESPEKIEATVARNKENDNNKSPIQSFGSIPDEIGNGLKPPDFLPVTSCFEPDDVTLNEANDYQTLLEDITSFDLYEDYEVVYSFPLKNLARLKQNLNNCSAINKQVPFYDQDWWLKECEEIISPYSLNKNFFRLVQDFEV